MHDILNQLLRRGVDYARTKADGSIFLHETARLANAETVGLLKRHGLKAIDSEHLDHDGKTARDYLNERQMASEDEEFETVFEDLLQDIGAAGSNPSIKTHSELDAVHPDPTHLPAIVDPLKNTVITSLTPLSSSEDEESDQESDEEIIGHNPPIFYDAVEDICEMLPTVEIVV